MIGGGSREGGEAGERESKVEIVVGEGAVELSLLGWVAYSTK